MVLVRRNPIVRGITALVTSTTRIKLSNYYRDTNLVKKGKVRTATSLPSVLRSKVMLAMTLNFMGRLGVGRSYLALFLEPIYLCA